MYNLLMQLMDPGCLTAVEHEALLAASYCDTLDRCSANIWGTLAEILPTDASVRGAAVAVAKAVRGNQDLESAGLPTQPLRCVLLAALLRLEDALDVHAEAVSERHQGSPPREEAELSCWLAYLTPKIRVGHRGVVTYHLVTPSVELLEDLKICTALKLETVVYELRGILGRYGIPIWAGPTEVTVSRKASVPASVIRKIQAHARETPRNLPSLRHLGAGADLTLETLLPLPGTAVRPGPIRFAGAAGSVAALRLWRGAPAGSPEFRVETGCRTAAPLVFDTAPLAAGSMYVWKLYRDDGVGPELTAAGSIRVLTDSEKLIWDLEGLSAEPSARRAVQMRLGLLDDILTELWPDLWTTEARFEDRVLGYRLMLGAYEWVRLNAPQTTQAGVYREAGHRLRELLGIEGRLQ